MTDDIELLAHNGLSLIVEAGAVYVQARNHRAMAQWHRIERSLAPKRLQALTHAARQADEVIRRARARTPA